jgi:hypothetical protein
MPEDRTGEILLKLNELIDLVKKNTTAPKVENHTHHHYPTYPTYQYPTTYPWTTGGSTGGFSGNIPSGVTWTNSTNDPNGTTNPTMITE